MVMAVLVIASEPGTVVQLVLKPAERALVWVCRNQPAAGRRIRLVEVQEQRAAQGYVVAYRQRAGCHRSARCHSRADVCHQRSIHTADSSQHLTTVQRQRLITTASNVERRVAANRY